MKMKILLGSIFAVAILILLSFTSVVGYRTNSSDLVDESPLFSIRTNRAIELDNSLYSGDYIGKGENNAISFPKRDNKKALIQDIITRISQMDDKSFNKLITNVITRLNQVDEFNDIDASRLILALHLLRTNPDKLQDYIIAEKNNNFETDTYYDCTFAGDWYLGCYIQRFICVILMIIYFFIELYYFIIIVISMVIPTCIFYDNCGDTLWWTCDEFCLVGRGIE